jgi:hypothetical protein
MVAKKDLQRGSLDPPLRDIRRISLAIAVSVAKKAHKLRSRAVETSAGPEDRHRAIEP